MANERKRPAGGLIHALSVMAAQQFFSGGISLAKPASAVTVGEFVDRKSKQEHPELTHMAKYKLEYIWLDGYEPVANLRGKTQVKEFDSFPTLEDLPMWAFDGSSTRQAEGHTSDCLLKPVAAYPDATKTNGVLVMCEVMLPDGKPHPSNGRATIHD